MMAWCTCSSHGLNGGTNANFARDVTLKSSRSKVCWISYIRITELVHEIIDRPLYSKTCVKRPLKNRQNKDLYDKW